MSELSFCLYPSVRQCPEFFQVVDFLNENEDAVGCWHWARWEWLISHPNLDEAMLPQIGIFRDGEKISGLVTHDMEPGIAYIICPSQYKPALPQMLDYGGKFITDNGRSGVFIESCDAFLSALAVEKGYSAADEKEYVLSMDCQTGLDYALPVGFTISDFSVKTDINEYCRVIWNGFENDGEPPEMTAADAPVRPHQNPKLTVFAIAPDGQYAAHCGMWYLPGTRRAYLEPLVTVPEFRRLGLGKAVVYEAAKRCAAMGAASVTVISNQEFYHRIGFTQTGVYTLWVR